MIFHPIYFLIFIALGVSIWTHFKVKRTGLSGAKAARKILNSKDLQHISISVNDLV